jgi:hypothetical protein
VVDAGLDQLAEARVERAQRIVGVGQPGGGHAGRVDAELVDHLVGRRQDGEHADRAGDRGFGSAMTSSDAIEIQ